MSGRLLNNTRSTFNREGNRHAQSPSYIQTRKGKQGQDIPVVGLRTRFENQASELGLNDGSLGPVVDDMFTVQIPEKGLKISEEIHHIHPLRNFDGLYANTTEQQGKQLQQLLRSGDDIRNLMVMPRYSHQGIQGLTEAIHTRMRAAGVEHGGKSLHPVMQQIDQAHGADFGTKLRLAQEYNKQVRPIVEEILDDVIGAAEAMQDDILNDARKGSTATASTMIDNQTYNLMGKRQVAAERAKIFQGK